MIRLVRATVEHFRAIERAEVELGPGLNVLHGPNDLGKSTLATALRAALLLPATSSEADKYASWAGEQAPRVSLTLQSGPELFHRVVKQFSTGSGASALLERSRDGVHFATEASGRAVDEKLRALLAWGIPAPGGSTRIKGVPQAFLAQALLAEQTDVDGILAESLTNDAEEGGKLRLTTALQAFAVDPRFKRALDDAQAEVDKHFTSKMRRTSKQGAPNVKAAAAVQDLTVELEALAEQAKGATLAGQRVRELGEAVAVADAGLTRAHQALAETERLQSMERARDGVRRELERAEAALADAEAQRKRAGEKAAQVLALESGVGNRQHAVEQCAQALARAAEALQDARLAEAREASEGAAAQRALHKSELEKKRAEVAHALATEATRRRAVDELIKAQAELEKRRREAQATREAAQAKSIQAAQARAEKERMLGQLEDLRAHLRWSDARDAVAASAAARAELEAAATEATRLRTAVAEQQAQARARVLPTLAEARALEALHRELELAEARLGGGMSLSVRTLRKANVEVRADGVVVDHDGPVSAERRLEIKLASVELEILAGRAEERKEVEALSARWAAEGRPVLERCGVASAAELAAACVSADQAQARLASLVVEAERLEARRTERAAQLVELEAKAAREPELDAALAGKDRARLTTLAQQAGPRWRLEADALEQSLRKDLSAARDAEQPAREAAASAQAKLEALAPEQARLEAQARPLGADLPAQSTAAAKRSKALELEQHGLDEKLGALVAAEGSRLQDAQQRTRDALAAHGRAEVALRDAEREAAAARSARDGLAGEARALAQAASLLPIEALRAAVSQRGTELAHLPAPERVTTEADLLDAREAVEQAERQVRDAREAHHEARGALKEAGGAMIEERRLELVEAHRAATDRLRAIEQDADAWRLLRDTLKESESAGNQHVGKVLADRIGPRFAQLTHRRYGGLELGPNLETLGVRTTDGNKAPAVLSVGTREQLATLLRLVIAEALESTVVLDDHLVQTDSERLGWFVGALAEAAKRVQVVVVTCRPRDYEAARALDGVSVSWVDLGERIRRSAAVLPGTAASAPAAAPVVDDAPSSAAVDARPLPELLRASLAELGMSPSEVAGALSAGPRTVELWLEGKQAPMGPFRTRLAALLGAGAAKGTARERAAEKLRQ